MGDSLSDRGTANKRLLFGFIPMRYLSGLHNYSPSGRFTNGLVWSDHLAASIANDFTIKRLEKKLHLDNTDIADAVISKDRRILSTMNNTYFLDNDRFIQYRGKLWVRSYCEGGLTAHDYSWMPSTSISRFFTRIIVATLQDKLKLNLNYDKTHIVPYKDKAETLAIEWSGANDLVTVNAKPSKKAADKAIAARVRNVKKMIASGYRHFILLNLPNLALTPRFQKGSESERKIAHDCTIYFNEQLNKAVANLTLDYPHCSIASYDINAEFETIYANADKYYFDKKKRNKAYKDSKDFNSPSDGKSAATGYIFYDDLHPTADMHAFLASRFYNQVSKNYQLLEPDRRTTESTNQCTETMLLSCFRKHYERKLYQDRHSFFGNFCKSKLNYKNSNLTDILHHAIKEGGQRTHDVLVQLGWINKDGHLILELEPLMHAYAQIRPAYARKMSQDFIFKPYQNNATYHNAC